MRNVLPPGYHMRRVRALCAAWLLLAATAALAEPLLLPCAVVAGLNDACPSWIGVYDGGGEDQPMDSAASPDGRRVYVTGTAAGGATGIDAVTMAYDAASGARLWAARWDSGLPPDATDSTYDVEVTPDGENVLVAGAACEAIADGNTCDLVVLAYAASTGEPLWSSVVHGPGLDAAFALAVDQGLVYVGGRSWQLGTGVDVLTLALDVATGDEVWRRRHHGGFGFDGASDLVLAGGTVVVTGPSQGKTGQQSDIVTLAYDAATGAPRWQARREGTIGQLLGSGIAVGGDLVAVSGVSAGASPLLPDYLVLAYDLATGAPRWTATWDGPTASVDQVTALQVAPSGDRVYVTGMSRNPDYDAVTLAYDGATGAQRWLARYDGPIGDGDAAFALAQAPGRDELYLLGSSYMGAAVGYQHVLVAYDASSGAQRWKVQHQGQGLRRLATPMSLAVAGDRVVASAQIADPTGLNPDTATLAYARP